MENDNQQWVAEKMMHLDPPSDWHTDSAAALKRLHQRRPAAPWWQWAAAAALFAGAILLLPAGRAAAQQFWQFLTVRRVAFIRVNPWPKGVPAPEVKLLGAMVPPIPSNDLDQIRFRVHYDPRLPRPGILTVTPRLSTTFSLSGGTVIRVADLQLAMEKTGVTGLTVPPQWEGAQLSIHTSAVVIAEWPDLVFAQSLPITLATPQGFDFPAFSTLILRILGVSPEEAQRLAKQMGTTPAWLAPMDRDFDKYATIEEIQLVSGPATLVEEKSNNGAPDRITLLWSVPDRIYLLNGTLSRELIVATANAVQ